VKVDFEMHILWLVGFMVFNATFKTISVTVKEIHIKHIYTLYVYVMYCY